MSRKRASAEDLAHITPSVLTWALNQSALDRAAVAKRLKVTVAQLAAWEDEDGEAQPQFDKAWDLAGIVGVPFGYLFLSDPPDASLPIPDFRRAAKPPSPEFRQLLSDSILKRDWYRDYVRSEGGPRATFVGRFAIGDGVMAIAADIRNTLGITPQLRRATDSWPDYLSVLAKRAEDKGILVLRTSIVGSNTNKPVPSSEVQGFALADQWAPLIFVNSADYKAAQIFTFAHELAHLWIAESGISNPDQGEGAPYAVERFCNRVAAEILAPKNEFVRAWEAKGPLSRVSALAREFWVSQLVVLNRGKELDLLSEGKYQQLRAEAVAALVKTKSSGGSYYRTAGVRLGGRLPTAVLGEVEKGNLPLTQASDLLGMSVPTLLRFAERRR